MAAAVTAACLTAACLAAAWPNAANKGSVTPPRVHDATV